jgi:hypothetical protein
VLLQQVADEQLMVPDELPRSARADVARQFGQEFADAIVAVEPRRWVGPLQSGYGIHLVWVSDRREGRKPALAEVRAQVERDFVSARRTRELAAMYEAMLARYQVTMETRGAVPGATAAAAGAPAGSSK